MMKYLLLLNRAEDEISKPGTPEGDRLLAGYSAALAAMGEAGVLIECAPLTAHSSATTLRIRDGEVLLTDGPAAELKEQVGGYTLIECENLDEALKWAALLPAASEASIEVRSVIDMGPVS
jgi:hypothetical protein